MYRVYEYSEDHVRVRVPQEVSVGRIVYSIDYVFDKLERLLFISGLECATVEKYSDIKISGIRLKMSYEKYMIVGHGKYEFQLTIKLRSGEVGRNGKWLRCDDEYYWEVDKDSVKEYFE